MLNAVCVLEIVNWGSQAHDNRIWKKIEAQRKSKDARGGGRIKIQFNSTAFSSRLNCASTCPKTPHGADGLNSISKRATSINKLWTWNRLLLRQQPAIVHETGKVLFEQWWIVAYEIVLLTVEGIDWHSSETFEASFDFFFSFSRSLISCVAVFGSKWSKKATISKGFIHLLCHIRQRDFTLEGWRRRDMSWKLI